MQLHVQSKTILNKVLLFLQRNKLECDAYGVKTLFGGKIISIRVQLVYAYVIV